MGVIFVGNNGVSISPEIIRDALLSLSDSERKFIISRPLSGQKQVFAIQLHGDGKVENECSDAPEL